MTEERREDAVVLGLLLDHHPAQLAGFELRRELGWKAWRVEDAVARLRRAGLLHRHGGFVFASRAAVRFYELGV